MSNDESVRVREIPIPTRFRLQGEWINIVHSKTLNYDQNYLGKADYNTNTIILQENVPGASFPKDKEENIYLHEVVHFILEKADGEAHNPPLYTNEPLVERIAGMLHQFLQTAEYKP